MNIYDKKNLAKALVKLLEAEQLIPHHDDPNLISKGDDPEDDDPETEGDDYFDNRNTILNAVESPLHKSIRKTLNAIKADYKKKV